MSEDKEDMNGLTKPDKVVDMGELGDKPKPDVPDFDLTDGNIKFSITTKDYPESTETVTKGPFTITKSTKKIDFRARGRQASIKVSTNSTEAKWRWGAIRVAFQPDGGR